MTAASLAPQCYQAEEKLIQLYQPATTAWDGTSMLIADSFQHREARQALILVSSM